MLTTQQIASSTSGSDLGQGVDTQVSVTRQDNLVPLVTRQQYPAAKKVM